MSAHSEFVYNYRLQEDQQKWQEKMFDMTNAWNLAQWHRENEYNLPVNQMQRLTDAGVNPNLAASNLIGNGNPSGGLTASSPSMGANGAGSGASLEDYLMQGANGINQSIQTYLAGEQQRAQIKYLDSQTDKTDAETQSINIDNTYKPAMNESNLNVAKANVQKMMSENKLTQIQGKQIDEMLPLMKNKTKGEIMSLATQAAKAAKDIQVADQQIGLIKEQIKTEKHQQGALDAAANASNASAVASRASAEVSNAEADRIKQTTPIEVLRQRRETELKAQESRKVKIENDFKDWCHQNGYDPNSGLATNMISLFLNNKVVNAVSKENPRYKTPDVPSVSSEDLLNTLRNVISDPNSKGVPNPQNVQGSKTFYNPIDYGY